MINNLLFQIKAILNSVLQKKLYFFPDASDVVLMASQHLL